MLLLHTCAHNPTEMIPTTEEWKIIAQLTEEMKLIPFFDSAYQWFASGDLKKDTTLLRYFVERGFKMFIDRSLTKNMELYEYIAGAILIVSSNLHKVK